MAVSASQWHPKSVITNYSFRQGITGFVDLLTHNYNNKNNNVHFYCSQRRPERLHNNPKTIFSKYIHIQNRQS